MRHSWLSREAAWPKTSHDRYVILDFTPEDNHSTGTALRGCWIKATYNKDIAVSVSSTTGFFIQIIDVRTWRERSPMGVWTSSPRTCLGELPPMSVNGGTKSGVRRTGCVGGTRNGKERPPVVSCLKEAVSQYLVGPYLYLVCPYQYLMFLYLSMS